MSPPTATRSAGTCSPGRCSVNRWCFTAPEPGTAVALADRCVHRRYPLSESRLDGDTIVCGYHGFTYDTDRQLRVRTGAEADPAHRPGRLLPRRRTGLPRLGLDRRPGTRRPGGVPRAPWLADPRYATVRGMEPIDARLRPAGRQPDRPVPRDVPARRLHRHPGGRRDPDHHRGGRGARASCDVRRHMDDAECPPFYARSTGIEGRITRWQDIEYHAPCLYLLHSRIAPAGVLPEADGERPGRLPRRDHVRHHPVHRRHHVRLLGGLAGLRASTTSRSPTSCTMQPHRGDAGRRRAQPPAEDPRRRAGAATRS